MAELNPEILQSLKRSQEKLPKHGIGKKYWERLTNAERKFQHALDVMDPAKMRTGATKRHSKKLI